MKFLAGRGPSGTHASPGGNAADVMGKLDAALTSVFSEDGKKTVLYYMSERYGLSLEGAASDPKRLEKAMTSLLGEIGWMVVKRSILEQFWERRIEVREMRIVESTPLREAFGFVRWLRPPGLFKPY